MVDTNDNILVFGRIYKQPNITDGRLLAENGQVSDMDRVKFSVEVTKHEARQI